MKAINKLTGAEVLGTLDTVQCRANIQYNSWKRNEDGTLDFEWEGDTEVFWDEQRTVQRDGKDLYLDEDGLEFTADQIELVEDEDEPDTSDIPEAGEEFFKAATLKLPQEDK